MQSEPITRDLNVRPPKELTNDRRKFCKQINLPYGVIEAGRQWQKVSRNSLTSIVAMSMIHGSGQLFIKRDSCSNIIVIMAKTVDDFLIAGVEGALTAFIKILNLRFDVGKSQTGRNVNFNGCDISVDDDGWATLSMQSYISRLKQLDISRARRKQHDRMAARNEEKEYRLQAGTLKYLGQCRGSASSTGFFTDASTVREVEGVASP